MTEIPQSTIEAALTAWHTPGVGVVGDAQREDAGMRRAIQAALDEGGLVLASELARMRPVVEAARELIDSGLDSGGARLRSLNLRDALAAYDKGERCEEDADA